MLSQILKKQRQQETKDGNPKEGKDTANKGYLSSNSKNNIGFKPKPTSIAGAARKRSLGTRNNKSGK
ncbi:hypothetical protein KKG22_04790 [Patescibacteria group bacterium]|nr:hypothetical protein [Patescibacteria group bacterium]MBU1721652.1 hypothetical protein [Patescibacteria group bacterium]MBU1901637.1 hypothetical protein [Patescibacteria group bacterium]